MFFVCDDKVTKSRKALLFLAIALSIPACFLAILYFSVVSTVQKKPSPHGEHSGKLVRIDGFDVIFQVIVDGHKVYNSPDFAPRDVDFREQISWDKTGHIIVLEVAGNRIFGYDTLRRIKLSNEELLNVQFTPFDDLGFEGLLPQSSIAMTIHKVD